jgi:hypothetical protein
VSGDPGPQIWIRFAEDEIVVLLRLRWSGMPKQELKCVVASLQLDFKLENVTELLRRFARKSKRWFEEPIIIA